MTEDTMRIGELAEKTGVSVRALRYYEEQSLLTPTRSPSGQRHYSEAAVERVQRIQQLYAAGLSSKTILELVPCLETYEVSPGTLERLQAERDRINRQIHDLIATLDRLDTAIAWTTAAQEGTPCPHERSFHAGQNPVLSVPTDSVEPGVPLAT